jgi:hypothetical protein
MSEGLIPLKAKLLSSKHGIAKGKRGMAFQDVSETKGVSDALGKSLKNACY